MLVQFNRSNEFWSYTSRTDNKHRKAKKNFKKIVKYAEITEINLERDKIYLCGFYTKNNFLAHCGIVIDRKILHINKNGAVSQSIGTIKRIYSLWSLKFYEIAYNSRT